MPGSARAGARSEQRHPGAAAGASPAPPSVHGAPVAAIAGHQPTGDQQNQIHEPPDAQAPQGQQLPHGGAGVAQAEPIHSEAAQEEGVEQSGDEVVSRVPAREEAAGSGSVSLPRRTSPAPPGGAPSRGCGGDRDSPT